MNLAKLVLISLLAGASTGLGGLVATIFKPSERNLVFGLSFSSGLMLGVAFLMLMPESLKGGFSLSFIGFIIGASLFLLLDFVLPHIHVLESSNSLRRLGTLIDLPPIVVPLLKVDTHGHSPWHFTGQAKLDLNPGVPATSHIR